VGAALSHPDDLIKRLGRPRAGDGVALPWPALIGLIALAGPIYGAFMGSYSLDSPERILMSLYSAVKVPILILGTSVVCLPAFFAFNTVAGLRADFGAAIRAVLAGQAALTVALVSLAPLTAVVYASGVDYRSALLFNAAMFTVATGFAQAVMRRRYRPLIEARPGHRLMLWLWVVLYAFVGVQMGWMLRPFIGSPDLPVTFFRQEPFSNAYIFVLRLIVGALH
jgi:hypothetical protein